MSDIIELSNLDDMNVDSNYSSSTFGPGIELFMNEKVKDTGNDIKDIGLDDLEDLEKELNEVTFDKEPIMNINKSDTFTELNSDDIEHSVKFEEDYSKPSIGSDTANRTTSGEQKTWDGYAKFNNIPLNVDKEIQNEPRMTKEELLREKFKYLRKLETLEKKGVELSKKYNMESPLSEMQGEYETIMDEKSKENSVKFQGNMMMSVISGIEFLNGRFDPFDIKLDGWGEQVNENISDYDSIFAELHEKYKSKGKMAPELKLLFQLGGSAMMVHMTNTLFKSSMPGMDDIFRQNPDLMRSFQSATVNSMAQNNPGFSGFMNGFMNDNPPNSNSSRPPAPVATKELPKYTTRPGNNSYSAQTDDGINVQEKSYRAEMKGPSDISDLLSGIKTKSINIRDNTTSGSTTNNNNDSTISISDLKSLQSDGGNIGAPKKSRRRQKSDKAISLDI